jgi:nucleoid-associated protein YgaU
MEAPGGAPLPAQYTVRQWTNAKDCLWNIAGRPWAYGDPHQWRLIYNANKSRMSDPDDPNLIEPGMVLDIPSLKGETRQGMWDPDKTYRSFR